MMKLRVVDAKSGEPANMGQMATRELIGKMLHPLIGMTVLDWYLGGSGTYLYLGYLVVGGILIVTGTTRQGTWDYLARTTVVRAD